MVSNVINMLRSTECLYLWFLDKTRALSGGKHGIVHLVVNQNGANVLLKKIVPSEPTRGVDWDILFRSVDEIPASQWLQASPLLHNYLFVNKVQPQSDLCVRVDVVFSTLLVALHAPGQTLTAMRSRLSETQNSIAATNSTMHRTLLQTKDTLVCEAIDQHPEVHGLDGRKMYEDSIKTLVQSHFSTSDGLKSFPRFRRALRAWVKSGLYFDSWALGMKDCRILQFAPVLDVHLYTDVTTKIRCRNENYTHTVQDERFELPTPSFASPRSDIDDFFGMIIDVTIAHRAGIERACTQGVRHVLVIDDTNNPMKTYLDVANQMATYPHKEFAQDVSRMQRRYNAAQVIPVVHVNTKHQTLTPMIRRLPWVVLKRQKAFCAHCGSTSLPCAGTARTSPRIC
jgi:hypothetical protein